MNLGALSTPMREISTARFGDSRLWLLFLVIVATLALCFAEILLPQIRFTLLFYLPVFVLAWKVSFRSAFIYCFVQAIVWSIGDYITHTHYSVALSAMNGLIKWVTFVIFAYVASGIHYLTLKQLHLQHELHTVTEQLANLEQLLPICATCKKVKVEDSHWTTVENYLKKKTDRPLTHAICPECFEVMMGGIDPKNQNSLQR